MIDSGSGPIIGYVAGIAKPTIGLRRRLAGVNGSMGEALRRAAEDEKAIDAFAGLLSQALQTVQTADGRIDMRDAAAFVLRSLQESNR
jgi:hypothetical protein